MLESKALRKDNTSGVTGVVRFHNGWRTQIAFKGKTYYLGTYEEKLEAITARERAEEHLYGAFLSQYYGKAAERQGAGQE